MTWYFSHTGILTVVVFPSCKAHYANTIVLKRYINIINFNWLSWLRDCSQFEPIFRWLFSFRSNWSWCCVWTLYSIPVSVVLISNNNFYPKIYALRNVQLFQLKAWCNKNNRFISKEILQRRILKTRVTSCSSEAYSLEQAQVHIHKHCKFSSAYVLETLESRSAQL